MPCSVAVFQQECSGCRFPVRPALVCALRPPSHTVNECQAPGGSRPLLPAQAPVQLVRFEQFVTTGFSSRGPQSDSPRAVPCRPLSLSWRKPVASSVVYTASRAASLCGGHSLHPLLPSQSPLLREEVPDLARRGVEVLGVDAWVPRTAPKHAHALRRAPRGTDSWLGPQGRFPSGENCP